MIKKLKDFDIGIFADAKNHERVVGGKKIADPLTANDYLELLVKKGEIDGDLIPEPKNRQGVSAVGALAYKSGITLTGRNSSPADVFFKSSPNYIEGAEVLFGMLAEGVALDTAQVQVMGADSISDSQSEKTFYTGADKLMFPTVQRQGLKREAELFSRNTVTMSDLVSNSATVSGGSFSALHIKEDDEFGMVRVAEGAKIPRMLLTTGKTTIGLLKYARAVELTYEVARRAKINQVLFRFRMMDMWDERVKVVAALDVAVNGDGNANGAPLVTLPDTAWSYRNIRNYQGSQEYNNGIPSASLFIGDLTQVLAIDALSDPVPNLAWTDNQKAMRRHGAGWVMPDGVTPLKFVPKNSALVGFKGIMGVTGGFGLEQLTEAGSIIAESEKTIENQKILYTKSVNYGWTKLHKLGFNRVGLS